MDTAGLTGRLTRICARRWYLRRFLGPLYRHAERKGFQGLVRENALRLLEEAHVARLTGDGEAQELATRALDHFESLARGGDAGAAFHLAEAHRTGFGRPMNHWKALEHCRAAADGGHEGARERLDQLEAREPVSNEHLDAFARRALLKATYARGRGEHHARTLGAWAAEVRREGIGLRSVLLLFGAAGLILGYLALDIYFSGMGGWRPDPARVAWGLFGKIHPPKDDSVGRALPGWARPDARNVAFVVSDMLGSRSGSFTVGDFRGQVVVLCLVDGKHPTPNEAGAYLRSLWRRDDPAFKFFLLYQPDRESGDDVNSWIQYALDFPPALPSGPKAFRPLGDPRLFPAFFVIDRRGRIRQRWTGFSQLLTDTALQAALAET